MSLPFKSMFLLFDNIFLSIIVSVHIWSLSTHVFTIQINAFSILTSFLSVFQIGTVWHHIIMTWIPGLIF